MSLTVSVVIPAFNAEAFVTEALDSVASQIRLPDAVVVVDDGSTDGTAAAVEAWAAAHPGLALHLLRTTPNRGLSSARNRAIAAVATDCIATLDADDAFEPDHLARLMVPLEAEPGVIVAFGDTREFSANGPAPETLLDRFGGRFQALPSEDRGTYRLLGGPVFQSLLPGSYIPVSAMVFRREEAITVGLYDPGLRRVEDRDFILRMARTGRFAFVPMIACRKRIHSTNISGPKFHLAMAEGGFGVLLRARVWLGDCSPEERQAVEDEIERAGEGMLYSASITGVMALARASTELRKAGLPHLAYQPKAWLRAIWYGVSRRLGTADD
jgi:glycosyltransferase involved in cell wall biosynthesis